MLCVVKIIIAIWNLCEYDKNRAYVELCCCFNNIRNDAGMIKQ